MKKRIIIAAALLIVAIAIILTAFITSKKKPEPVQTTVPVTETTTEPDTTPPVLLAAEVTKVKVGSESIPYPTICIDDRDRNVIITYEGEYDLNTIGEYKLTRVATDSAGNSSKAEFTLKVMQDVPEVKNVRMDTVYLSDVMTAYKNENTKIGIDVSRWQGNINWTKVKDAGIEFVMMRIGGQEGVDGERYIDRNFVQYYKGAKEAGLQVGCYFYTCAVCDEDAATDAKMIVDTLKENNCELDLPVAYDWEEWGQLAGRKISLLDMNGAFETFCKYIEKQGYTTCLYQSKYYLEGGLWKNLDKHQVWLAHYTKQTTYEGDYFMWQLCNTGVVPGINGDVDIDVMYLNK